MMATRSPAASARGLTMSGKPRHLGRHCLVFVPSEERAERSPVERRRARRRQEAFLRAAMTGEGVLDTFERELTGFDGMNHGFERGELRFLRRAAQKHRIATRGDRLQ